MKVLVAIDDSHCSGAAVESILNRNWTSETIFRVVMVAEPIYLEYGYVAGHVADRLVEAERQLVDYCKKNVDTKVALMRERLGVDRVDGQVIQGSIADSIIAEAKQWEADLIIVGSHGRRGFQKFLLGSVAEKVVGHAPCSVEVVREKNGHEQSGQKVAKEKDIVEAGR